MAGSVWLWEKIGRRSGEKIGAYISILQLIQKSMPRTEIYITLLYNVSG